MANPNIPLESLYHYVVKHKKPELTDILCFFDTNKEYLLEKLSELQLMGLPLSISSHYVQLSNSNNALDINFIQSHVGIKTHYLFSTTSTNLLVKACSGDAVYITEHQSHGRGQHGKSWLTPLGQSIALSIKKSFGLPLAKLTGLNIAIGVAVITTIKRFSNQSMSLKWPNDIIGDRGKIAGILIEAQGNHNSCTAHIGVGINWSLTSQQLASINQPCMNAQITRVNRSEFIVFLIKEITKTLEKFKSNQLDDIINLWRKYDLFKNKEIVASTPSGSFNAKYIEVNTDGMLLVSVKGKNKVLSSASIKLHQYQAIIKNNTELQQ